MKWNKISKKEPKVGRHCIFLTGNYSNPVFHEFGTRYERVEGYAYTTKRKPHYWLYVTGTLPPRPNKSGRK